MIIVQHSSTTNEHYTPDYIVKAARLTLDQIDLDPASTKSANRLVKAKKIYTMEQNGLIKPWKGNVFLNPPGGLVDKDGRRVIRSNKRAGVRPCSETGECGLAVGHKHVGTMSSAVCWWKKLDWEFRSGNVENAIFVGFSIEILQTTQSLGGHLPTNFPLCVPRERIPFDRIEDNKRVKGSQPTHANVIVCMTDDEEVEERFLVAFSEVGSVFNM